MTEENLQTDYPEPFAGGRRSMLALFNRQSGVFMMLMARQGDTDPDIDETHYIVNLVEIDPDTEMVVGKADNFQVVTQAEQSPVIDEYTVNARCRDKIEKVWPQHRQLNAMADVLGVVVESLQLDSPALVSFMQMREYIAQCRERNALYKKAYSTHPDFEYLDKSAVNRRVNDELSGGLSEVIGGPLRPVDLPHGGLD